MRRDGRLPVIKMRGLPWTTTMADILAFFNGFYLTEVRACTCASASCHPTMQSGIVIGTNKAGRLSGEAWVTFPSVGAHAT